MAASRDALSDIESLRARLSTCGREELVALVEDLLKVYVIDGTQPHAPEFGAVPLPTHLRELSFSQLISHLKMHLALPELDRFSVSGREVMVRIGEREYSLGDPNTALPPAEHRMAATTTASEAERSAPPADDPPDVPEGEVDDRFRMLEFD